MLKLDEKTQIPLREFDFVFARSSGPGGQNVNKVNTKATLSWDIESTESIDSALKNRFRTRYGRRINKEGKVIIHSQRFRDQGRNVADCITKLQELLRSVLYVPKFRKKTKPSKRSNQRRIDSKKANSTKKQNRKSVRDSDYTPDFNCLFHQIGPRFPILLSGFVGATRIVETHPKTIRNSVNFVFF